MLWVDLKLYIIFLSQPGPAIQILEQREGEKEMQERRRRKSCTEWLSLAYSMLHCHQ